VQQLGEKDIVERVKHDANSFLEGLEALPDDLGFVESAGLYGTSRLFAYSRQADNVDVLDSHDLDSKYFGEGITMLGNKVYQLTYKEGDALVYDVTDSASPTTVGEPTVLPDVVSQFDTKEGWGMTNDGTHAIASDGSASLYFLEPETLKVVKTIAVIGQDPSGSIIDQINELEYIDGLIYFNIWMKDIIGVYDIESNQVTRWFDLSEIAIKERSVSPMAEVLNGITFTRPKDTSEPRMLVVTGKQWQNLYVLNHTVPAGR
jgi:glutamine cyclotransferase